MNFVKLVSCDGIAFQVDAQVAKKSFTIKLLLESISYDDYDDNYIPLPTINSATLIKVIQWANHYKHVPAPGSIGPVGAPRIPPSCAHRMTQWDIEFLRLDQPMLFDIILAANYLDMKDLLDVACQAVAKKIENKTVDDIRALFNIVNDFSPEEVANPDSDLSQCLL